MKIKNWIPVIAGAVMLIFSARRAHAQEFGLVSETIPGITFDTDSYLGTYNGGTGSTVDIKTDLIEFREGKQSLKFNLSCGPNSGFAGSFIQWGVNGTADSVNRNMTAFSTGTVRFWLKADSSFAGILWVGIRSGNVPAGSETSKVLLFSSMATDGAANIFDNNWHPIKIAVSSFTAPAGNADLTQIKVLFNIFAVTSGPLTTNGFKNFYVDNVRWDSYVPGPLNRIAVSPNPVTVPLNARRQFIAKGLDTNGITVDIWPTWKITSGSIGTISPSSPTASITTLLTAASSAGSGTISVSTTGVGGIQISSVVAVNVADVAFSQFYNVYNDNGSGGFVGISTGGAAGTNLTLSEQPGGVTGDAVTHRSSTFTLVDSAGQQDAFALWFTEEQFGSRYMHYFSDGYLYFNVRSTTDLQVSIRSNNIAPGAERSKIRLSDYGVPLDNTWQKVIIALADFKTLEPNLDFDQIKTYFAIGGVAAQIGPVANRVFDVDDARWLTNNPNAVDENKVYAGLKAKQNAGSGLVLSFDNDASSRAVTYDQALAAMAYTYRADTTTAKNIFNAYKRKYDAGSTAGFHDEYKWDSPGGSPPTVLVSSRTAGPNAWLLLALVQYRTVSGDTTFDPMMDSLASWLKSLQDGADGGVRFGFNGDPGTLLLNKSTEHNFDCYAAFRAYAVLRSSAPMQTAATAVQNWLAVKAYNPGLGRFNVGLDSGGGANTDKALDVYSWAPLAMSSYSAVLPKAETDFENTKLCDLTGVNVDGFDFGGLTTVATSYTDAVWLEGTGQMVDAYWSVGNTAQANHFILELEKSIVPTSNLTQGMAYATNGGTGYGGFKMDSLHPSVSAMAWYLFAKDKFNPLQSSSLGNSFDITIRNVSDNAVVSTVTWTVTVPTNTWIRANQYIQLAAQPNSIQPWGIQIYTDNTNAAAVPRFVDPTPAISSNTDSDPGGLLLKLTGISTSSVRLPLGWNIEDTTSTAVSAVAPAVNDGNPHPPNSFLWFYMKDKAGPAIDTNGNGSLTDPTDSTAFQNGEDYVILESTSGIHTSQGSGGYTPALPPDNIYLEADFSTASAQETYRTNMITVEFFIQ